MQISMSAQTLAAVPALTGPPSSTLTNAGTAPSFSMLACSRSMLVISNIVMFASAGARAESDTIRSMQGR